MAQVGKTVPEGDRELPPRDFISTRNGSSSQTCLDSIGSSEMDLLRSVSKSPSRPRAATTSSTLQAQMARPRVSSVGLPSREPSPGEYRLHTQYEDFGFRRNQRSTIEPRYVERCLEIRQSHDDPDKCQEIITTPTSEEALQLTPSTNGSSRTSEIEELRKLPVPNAPSGARHLEPKEHPSFPSETFDSKLEMHSPLPTTVFQHLSLNQDDDLDDKNSQNDSEEDFFEQHWVSANKNFEARVLRATENNFSLASQLIPQLYEIFQQEESSIVGFWEAGYRNHAGSSYDQGSGRSGESNGSFSSYISHNTHSRRGQRGNNDGNREGTNDGQGGDRDGEGGNRKGNGSRDLQSPPLACPLNKRYPSHYNGSYRSSNGKPVYKGCATGFVDYQRFREHLQRVHRHVQCEKCSLIFTVPQAERELAYQIHLQNPSDCGNTPPPVNEGITELQWARINHLQVQSRSTAESSNRNLNVVKWNNVWDVLFPGEARHQPWYTPNFKQQPTLDEEAESFRRCFISDPKEHVDPEENAVSAFRTWFYKRRIEHQDLQETQQEISQMMIEEYPSSQMMYPPLEEGQLEPPIASLGTAQFQGQPEMGRVLSHQHPLQSYSNGQESQNASLGTRRNFTEPDLRQQGFEYLPVAQAPIATYREPNLTHLQAQSNSHQFGYINPEFVSGSNEQPSFRDFELQGAPLENQSAATMDYDIPGNPSQYYNNSSAIVMNGAPDFQETNFNPLPLLPQYNTNQVQQSGLIQTQRHAPLHDQANHQQQIQSQQTNLSYPKPHPKRHVPQNAANYPNPNARHNTYGS